MLKHVVTPKEIASKCIYPQMSRVCVSFIYLPAFHLIETLYDGI